MEIATLILPWCRDGNYGCLFDGTSNLSLTGKVTYLHTDATRTGYDKGKSDAVKQQYWLYVSMQRQRNQVTNVRLYPVQLPEQRIDGVTFQPSTKLLRIEE
jgi:hypothetical protein